MTDREKLVELIEESASLTGYVCAGEWNYSLNTDDIADHLIANGVAVRQWRDAKTDPPPLGKDVLLRFANETMVVGGLREDGGWYAITDAEWYTNCETVPEKWQPLPDVSKED